MAQHPDDTSPKTPRWQDIPPEARLGDKPIVADQRARMQAVAETLDKVFNGDARGADRPVGFVLLVFPFGHAEGQRCNFISNGADRRDLAALFREMAARFEGQPEQKGTA